MPSLTTCLRKIGARLDADDKALLIQGARTARRGGLDVHGATLQALDQHILHVQGLLDALKPRSGGLSVQEPQPVQAPGPGSSPDPREGASYQADLFGTPVSLSADSPSAPRPGAWADTQAPPGDYRTRTLVGTEMQRKIGATRIRDASQAAAATRYLHDRAVERFDGVVVNAQGQPLAVIGGFKGAITQSSVYPATLVGEAVRIPGATAVWFTHNHPSGSSELSDADRRLSEVLVDAFKGSGIEAKGLLAITGDRFDHVGEQGARVTGKVPLSTASVTVPAIERVLGTPNPGERLENPAAATRVARGFYESGKPGILMLDAQHRALAWVPLSSSMSGKLRHTGGLNAIYRAVSEANASAAVLVHGGELDSLVAQTGNTIGENVAGALSKVDVRVIDSINAVTGASKALSGDKLASSLVFKLADRRAAEREGAAALARDTLIAPSTTPLTEPAGRVPELPLPSATDRAAVARLQEVFNLIRPGLTLQAVPARSGAGPLSEAELGRVAAAELGATFNKRVTYVKASERLFSGVVDRREPARIFIHVDTDHPYAAVLGHELVHDMARSQPVLYNQLNRRLRELQRSHPSEFYQEQRLARTEAGLPQIGNIKLRQEFVANVVGDRFMEPEFWRLMAQDQPSGFRAVIQHVLQWLDAVIARLVDARPFGTDAYISDLRQTRQAVAETMTRYRALVPPPLDSAGPAVRHGGPGLQAPAATGRGARPPRAAPMERPAGIVGGIAAGAEREVTP